MSDRAESHPRGELYCSVCEQLFDTGEECPKDGARLVRLVVQIDPFLGRELDGRYTILEKIGHGGMGAVYRGTQHSVDREVAIKVVSPSLVSDTDTIRRFLREAKLASRLNHPNAVGVVDFGQAPDGVFYLVMELVAGRTLEQAIKEGARFSPGRMVRIARQVCDALDAAHSLSIVHRDLKPANIMMLATQRDFVKVLDFGLAKSLSADAATTTMSGTGKLLGTPAFMPPELATGAACDGRADLYSLGCILYLMGSGRLPFQSNSPHELIAMHGSDSPPPMAGVPPELAAVIDRLLAKDPGDRYQTAAETREALENALGGWRATTPGPDSLVGITPFPATGPNKIVDIPSGRVSMRRSETDIDRMVEADPLPAAPPSSLPAAAPRSTRIRWLVAVVIAVAVVVAVAVGIASRGGDTRTAGDRTPTPAPIAEPAPAPASPPPASPPPVEAAKPPPVEATVPDAVPRPAVPSKRPPGPHRVNPPATKKRAGATTVPVDPDLPF